MEQEESKKPPSTLEISPSGDGDNPMAASPIAGSSFGQPLNAERVRQAVSNTILESPLSSDDFVKDDPFAIETLELCSRFFRQTSRPSLRKKRLKRHKTSDSVPSPASSRKTSVDEESVKQARDRLLKFSRELDNLKSRPAREIIAHAKQSSDTSGNTSQLNTLRGNTRFNSGSSNENRGIVVNHSRAKSDPTVHNRVNDPKLERAIGNDGTSNPVAVSDSKGTSVRKTGASIKPPDIRRVQSTATVNHHSITRPPRTTESNNTTGFRFNGSRTSVQSDDNKIVKSLKKWFKEKFKDKNGEKKKERSVEKAKKTKVKTYSGNISQTSNLEAGHGHISQADGGGESGGGSQPSSLTRQNSLSAKLRDKLHFSSNIFNGSVNRGDPGYEADTDRELQQSKDEAKTKRLKKRSELDSSREPSFSQHDENERAGTSAGGGVAGSLPQSMSLQGFGANNNLRRPIYANQDTSGMQPNMGNSNVNHRLSVPGIPSEYDDVFLSSGENRSGANSMTNVLALSEDAHAPIARMDSAMDEDVVTQPGSTEPIHSNASATLQPQPSAASVDPSPRPSNSGDKFDWMVDRLITISSQPDVAKIVETVPVFQNVDPLSGVRIVIPPIGPGTSDNPDEEDRRMRKASIQLLAGIQPLNPSEPSLYSRLVDSGYSEFSEIINAILGRSPSRQQQQLMQDGAAGGPMTPSTSTASPSSCQTMVSPNWSEAGSSTAQPSSSSGPRLNDSNNNSLAVPSTQRLFTLFLTVIRGVVEHSDDPLTRLAANVFLYISENFRDRVEGAGGYESVFSDQQNTSDEN
ncbi:uncharacterized protein LOC134848013 [Symsagittifera roscoffensis]|uniref:uncharacterized protein LOC134848013 n=1 Tax=Symsagittifera roscoffensis TaxID=84072 RepID=UPI00307CC454